MTLEEVIRTRKQFEKPHVKCWSPTTWVWFGLELPCAIFFIYIFIQTVHSPSWQLDILTVFFAFSTIGGLVTFADEWDQDIENHIEQWKEKIAIPFINSLPIEKHEVLSIHILNEPIFFQPTQNEPISITVSFKKDNSIQTITNEAIFISDLNESETPYIEYQKLNKDLGNEIYSGFYNLKLHLPKQYQI